MECREAIIMREFRVRHGLKQEDVAKQLNVSRQMYSVAERYGWKGLSDRLKNAIIEYMTSVDGSNPFEEKAADMAAKTPADVYNHLRRVVYASKEMPLGERRIVLEMIRWCLGEVAESVGNGEGNTCSQKNSSSLS